MDFKKMHIVARSAWGLCFVLLTSAVCFGHLGEVHPAGQHQYFPAVADSEVPFAVQQIDFTTGSWWTDAQFVPGDDRLIISSRFQSQYLVTDSGRSLFLKTGEDYRWTNEGMPAFEFHPGYSDPESPGYGKFYSITTEVDSVELPDFSSGTVSAVHNVIKEWTMADPGASTFSGTSRVMLRLQKQNKVHNANDLAFMNDGTLLIAVGEDNRQAPAQDLGVAFGKILRIDPLGSNSANGSYGIPADNPFVDDPGSLDEIYAYGFRNPWRLTVDRETNEAWVFDVGGVSSEEVNRITPGGNYGWPIKEGSLLRQGGIRRDEPDPTTGETTAQRLGLIDPLLEYDHLQGVAIVGGFVYRGQQFPWLQGKVIFGDVGVGNVVTPAPRLMYGDPDTREIFELMGQEGVDSIWGKTCNTADGKVSCPIYSINEDVDGEILVLGKSLLRVASLPADFNNNGLLDVADIDALTEQVRSGLNDLAYDVDQDGDVDSGDRVFWVENRKQTYFGDANLDGRFDSGDLVQVLGGGEFEDGIPNNSSWLTGDWSGNGDFGTEDVILALQGGGYDAGPVPVPEPSAAILAISAVFCSIVARARGRWLHR